MSKAPVAAGHAVSGLMIMLFGLVLLAAIGALAPATAQQASDDRAVTGGAPTLEDILRRQQGLEVDDSARRQNIGDPGGAGPSGQLGTLGGASDSEIWRALRFDQADVTTQVRGHANQVLIQDRGMGWLQFREGPMRTYGGLLLIVVTLALVAFYFTRGKIMVEHGLSGVTIERFKAVERFGHWLLAGSFILLSISGLIVLFGRNGLIDIVGHEIYADMAGFSKVVHNTVAWPFMLALVMVFFLWVAHNIPNKIDLKWMMKGGGLFSKHSHPSARKFNAGQKVLFWTTIILGASVSASGLSLLFPFELPLFEKTFGFLTSIGITWLPFYGTIPVDMTPHEEMQLSTLWHSIVAFGMMALIIAHIYIGSVGMQGAFDAMGSGQVDVNWAKEHHDLWVAEVQEQERQGGAKAPTGGGTQPAE